MLYTLFAIELLVALIWTSFAISYPNPFGLGIQTHWWWAIVSGSICLILILLTLFMTSLQNSPINLIVYVVFTLCFMHFVSWLVLNEKNFIVYFGLWLLFGISFGMAIYAWSTITYMWSMFSLFVVCVCCLLIFMLFLIFSEISFFWLVIVLLIMMIVGFYLNYDVRRMVRGGIYDYGDDDPWTGAVWIWAEGVLVFCRFFEMLGKGCCKNKF